MPAILFPIIAEAFNGAILLICIVRFVQMWSKKTRSSGAGKLALTCVAVMTLGELLGGLYKPLETLCMRGLYPDVCNLKDSVAARIFIDASWLAADLCLFAAATMYNFDLLRRYGLVQSVEQSLLIFVPIMRWVYGIAFVLTNIGNFLLILKFTDHSSLGALICGGVQALFYINVIVSDLFISIRIIKIFSRTYNDLDNSLRTISCLGEYSGSNNALVSVGSTGKQVRIGKRNDLVRQLKRMVYVVCVCDVLAIAAFLIGMRFPQHELEFTQFSAAAYVGHVLFGFAFLSKLKNAMGDCSVPQSFARRRPQGYPFSPEGSGWANGGNIATDIKWVPAKV